MRGTKKRKTTRGTTIPGVVQLPGGVRLTGVPFRVIEWHEDGTPKMFMILPRDHKTGPNEAVWVLFCDEQAIRTAKRKQ